jgi:hypothetical protein
MTDTPQRRSSDCTILESRVTVLECSQGELVKSFERHAIIIEKLLGQDNEAMIALTSINVKFDSLIRQIEASFKIFLACSTLICTVVGGFWIYSHDLDQKYAPKLDKIISNASYQDIESVKRYQENKDNIQDIETDVNKLQRNRVNKASK